MLELRVGEAVLRRQQSRRKNGAARGIEFDQQPGGTLLHHEHALIAGVHRDPLQAFVIRPGGEVSGDAGVVVHPGQGLTPQFPAAGQINADHRIGLLMHRKQAFAISAEGDSLQVVRVQRERLIGQHLSLEVHAEDGPGVVADGVQRRAIGVEGEARRLIQAEARGIDALPVQQLKAEGAHQRCVITNGRHRSGTSTHQRCSDS
ncbi:MAG: Uncharacterised protein [Synechococcus sp. CC9902]|nr:MAG: Uncharacterised protein [Synechococcus sp. CC9902]